MPRNTITPESTVAVDRLSLDISVARDGAESSTTGACGSGCALCVCFDANE